MVVKKTEIAVAVSAFTSGILAVAGITAVLIYRTLPPSLLPATAISGCTTVVLAGVLYRKYGHSFVELLPFRQCLRNGDTEYSDKAEHDTPRHESSEKQG